MNSSRISTRNIWENTSFPSWTGRSASYKHLPNCRWICTCLSNGSFWVSSTQLYIFSHTFHCWNPQGNQISVFPSKKNVSLLNERDRANTASKSDIHSGFILNGSTLKLQEIFTLYIAVVYSGDILSPLNMVGLVICLTGISLHIVYKTIHQANGGELTSSCYNNIINRCWLSWTFFYALIILLTLRYLHLPYAF